jgi:predicted O-methyltransferase YrrM
MEVIPKLNQNEEEFYYLLRLYKMMSPMRVLEVGSYEGGTLYQWIRHAPLGAFILSIDDQQINRDHYREWAGDRVSINWFKGDSKSVEAINLARLNAPYHFIFIDGDHTYEGVKADWENYSPMCIETGVIAFHDILPHEPYNGLPVEVDRLWNEIKNDFPHNEIVKPNSKWGEGPGIGVLSYV